MNKTATIDRNREEHKGWSDPEVKEINRNRYPVPPGDITRSVKPRFNIRNNPKTTQALKDPLCTP